MAFVLSGTTITQSGTDVGLSGLAAVGGVNTVTQGSITTYDIGNVRFVVTGTLTIEPEEETLFIGYRSGDLVQVNGGELIIGSAITKDGFTRYSEGLAIYLDTSPLGFTNRFSVSNAGKLTWNGGVISMYAGKFGFYGHTCVVRINSINAKFMFRTVDVQNQVRQETNDFISTAFELIGGDLTIVGVGQQLNGYRSTHCGGALAFSSATPNVDVLLRDYSGGGRGNTKDVKFWAGCRPYLINSASGSELNAGSHISGHRFSYGILRVFQELTLDVKEFGSGAIEGAKLFFTDYDNGNRRLYNNESPHIDLRQTFTYTGLSDASGNIATQQIMIGNVVGDSSYGSAGSGVNTGRYAWDYRSKNNNIEDLFDMQVMSYKHSIVRLTNIPLQGVGGTFLEAVMFIDLLITEASKTVVDAYLTLDTPYQVYDKAKSYLYDNYSGESSQLVDRAGTQVVIGNSNLTIDATAAQVLEVLAPKFRYIRVWMRGSSRNAGNHLVEVQAIAQGVNLALNKSISTNSVRLTNIATVTDGDTSTGSHSNQDTGLVWTTVDLGAEYVIDEVKVWRYYADSRTYHETKVEVSIDNANWVVLQDSAVTGEYPESSGGLSLAIPSDADEVTTVVIKSAQYVGGVSATTGSVTLNNGSVINGGQFDCDVNLNSLNDLSSLTINGTLTFSVAGTYDLTDCNVTSVANTSAGNVIINTLGTTSIINNLGVNITIVEAQKTFSFTVSPLPTPGYEWRLYTVTSEGSLVGAVEIAGNENETEATNTYLHSFSNQPVGLQIMSTEHVEITTYVTLTSTDSSVTINLKLDNND